MYVKNIDNKYKHNETKKHSKDDLLLPLELLTSSFFRDLVDNLSQRLLLLPPNNSNHGRPFVNLQNYNHKVDLMRNIKPKYLNKCLKT